MKKITYLLIAALLISMLSVPAFAEPGNSSMGINVLLNQDINDDILTELGTHGKVLNTMYEIDALTMRIKSSDLENIKALPYVSAANPDAERNGSPIDTVPVTNMANGLSTWDLDAINVTDFGFANRTIPQNGAGVYVAVLDTGLVDMWRQYFPEERIAEEYAISFGGGGGQSVNVSEQPNKWEHDTDSHGTHVTSTIIGYSLNGTPVNGVAPYATIIPVKVLNQNGSGWSSVISQGITYIADLKNGPLADYPVVINMSLGGSALDAVEKAAIDYAIESGVIIVASAGNSGNAGMGYPGAYEPVISVAASGHVDEWKLGGSWWYATNIAEPTNADDFYITGFSSRALSGQDLDVVAPGSWIVGPYNTNSGQTSYYFMGGTSMASPHVAGVVALMVQKDPTLTALEAEQYLEASAIPIAAGSRTIMAGPVGPYIEVSWGSNATGSGLVDAEAVLDMIP